MGFCTMVQVSVKGGTEFMSVMMTTAEAGDGQGEHAEHASGHADQQDEEHAEHARACNEQDDNRLTAAVDGWCGDACKSEESEHGAQQARHDEQQHQQDEEQGQLQQQQHDAEAYSTPGVTDAVYAQPTIRTTGRGGRHVRIARACAAMYIEMGHCRAITSNKDWRSYLQWSLKNHWDHYVELGADRLWSMVNWKGHRY